MQIKLKKKRSMTLLEIMIVIFIIGIISGVIGYNMKGSLEKAKAFKTSEGIKKLKEIFELELAQGATTTDRILSHPEKVLQNSGFVSQPKEFLKDGWGHSYQIAFSKSGALVIKSEAYQRYLNKHKQNAGKDSEIAMGDDDFEDNDDQD